jgi:zinc protease
MNKVQHLLQGLNVRALPGPDTIVRRQLPNGIVLLTRENFASPSVSVAGFMPVGALHERREEAGLAFLTAQALMRGTSAQSFAEIFESLESIGARLGYGSGTHSTGFRGKALVEDLDVLLSLLADTLRTPRFLKQQVDRVRAEHLTRLALRAQSTRSQAQMAFDELLYPDHPYGVSPEGYRHTVEKIEAKDLRGFQRAHYGPRGMVLAVVGAVTSKKAFGLVEAALGDWRNDRQSETPALPPAKPPGQALKTERPVAGKTQTDLVIGAIGPSRFEDDYLHASLGNHVLGRFGLSGRIGEAVRERAGLAYYAYSSISGGPGPGPWQVQAGVNPADLDRALDLIRAEIERFCTKRITRKELQESQTNVIGQLPLQLESNEGMAATLVHLERYQLGLDYLQRYPRLVAEITPALILTAAQRYLDPERLALATSGPAGRAA